MLEKSIGSPITTLIGQRCANGDSSMGVENENV